jgi:large subunit ribosomal protein L25
MGGLLDHVRYEIGVKGPVSKLPSHIDLDISALEVGDAIRIKDVKFKEGIEVLDPPQAMIVAVASTRRQAASLAVEEASEAEAEGEGEGEEGAEGEAAASETETKE